MEAAEKLPNFQGAAGMALQRVFQRLDIHLPVFVLGNFDHVGDGLAPGKFVGMMLVRSDEHHRPFGLGNLPGEAMGPVETRRDADFKDVDQLVDRRRRARAAEDHQIVVAAMNASLDDAPGILAKPGGLPAGAGSFAMGVGVEGHDLFADVILDEIQTAARSRIVRIDQRPRPIWPVQHPVFADQCPANGFDKVVGNWRHGCDSWR